MRYRAISSTSNEDRPGGSGARGVVLYLVDGSQVTLTLNGVTEVRLPSVVDVVSMRPQQGTLRGQLLLYPDPETPTIPSVMKRSIWDRLRKPDL